MDMRGNRLYKKKLPKPPRKIMVVTSSKYGMFETINSNKKYWKSVFDQIDGNASESIEESKRIAKALPPNIYHRVCNTLNIPIVHYQKDEVQDITEKLVRRSVKEPLLSTRKSLYIDREMDSDTDVDFYPSDDEEQLNIHQELLNKPEREQVTWATRYLQPEREEEKSLIRKADDLTERIATDFCKYMKELGGDQQSQLFTPKAIKELFQIEFDTHVARGLRVITKELPCVEDKIATVTGYPEKSRHAALEREISRDIQAEHRPDRRSAFGTSLSRQDRWRAPRNDTKNLWRSARHVPKDLVTLKTVWEGITHLRSVKEYCRWMIDHPEHRRAPYLSSLGMFDPAVLEARLTFEARGSPLASPHEAPAPPIDHIRRRLSQLVEKHPEHGRAPYLSRVGMFDPAVLEARLTFEARGLPLAYPSEEPAPPIDHIRRRLSQLVENHSEHRRAPCLSSLGMFDPAVLEARGSPLASPHEAPAPAINHIRRRLSQLVEKYLEHRRAPCLSSLGIFDRWRLRDAGLTDRLPERGARAAHRPHQAPAVTAG